ncbi:MAG: lysylphosphatidylglycerol synthase domain-containing protein [Acidimicrobiales bacterium]
MAHVAVERPPDTAEASWSEVPASILGGSTSSRLFRLVALVVAIGVVGWAIAAHHAVVIRAVAATTRLQPGPLLLAATGMVAVYATSSAALAVASGIALPWRHNFAVQLAGVSANRVLPGGLGSKALHARFLARSGATGPAAVAAVLVLAAASAVVRAVVSLIGVAFLTSRGDLRAVPLRSLTTLVWPIAAVASVGAGTALVISLTRRLLHRDLGAGRLRQLRLLAAELTISLARRPGRFAVITVLFAAEQVAYAVVFLLCVRAAGGGVGLLAGVCICWCGSLAAAAVPVGGGLGAVEVALTTLLHGAAGMHVTAALAAVLAFRLISYWGPAIPGIATCRSLRHAQLI